MISMKVCMCVVCVCVGVVVDACGVLFLTAFLWFCLCLHVILTGVYGLIMSDCLMMWLCAAPSFVGFPYGPMAVDENRCGL